MGFSVFGAETRSDTVKPAVNRRAAWRQEKAVFTIIVPSRRFIYIKVAWARSKYKYKHPLKL